MEYSNREELKENAYKIINKSQNKDEIIKAILMICEAHYYRSKESSKRRHPNLETYTKHWIHSDINSVENILKISGKDKRVISETIKALIKRFPKPSPLKIRKGSSYWGC